MAGHSKWANIKHRKAAQGARRGTLKLIDMLEDLDGVQVVYHNADISGEIMDSL